jgi:arylsulfatase A-like enzyme
LLLYVNFHDTHFPYTHQFVRPLVDSTILRRSEISAARRAELWRMYLNTAANVDKAIGDVIARVRSTMGRTPAVIVTADHGESLFEEGFLGHGYGLNDAQTRIPLVVANLPMIIREPWGLADLRDELREALSAPTENVRPRLEAVQRPVFQYLGHLTAPPQIAWTTGAGRTTYDFRTNQFQIPGGRWQRPDDLDATSRVTFNELVHQWERMVLASTQPQNLE